MKLHSCRHRALDEIARGNPDAFCELYSRSDDAMVANPYGPPARGWAQIEVAGRRAAGNYRDGRALGFESFARYVSEDLGYTLEIERVATKVAGADELTRQRNAGVLLGRVGTGAKRRAATLPRTFCLHATLCGVLGVRTAVDDPLAYMPDRDDGVTLVLAEALDMIKSYWRTFGP